MFAQTAGRLTVCHLNDSQLRDRLCEALSSYRFCFSFTDAPTRLAGWSSSFPGSVVEESQDGGRLVVYVELSTGLGAGQTGTIGLHALRTGRVHFGNGADDVDCRLGLVSLVRAPNSSVTVIFPQVEEGWRVSAADASERTTRTARWEFVHGVDYKQIRARATKHTHDDEAVDVKLLVYDDLLADTQALIGKLSCGETPLLDSIVESAKVLGDTSVLAGIEAVLTDAMNHTGEAQLEDLRRLTAMFRARRVAFARALKVATRNDHLGGLPSGHPGYGATMVPTGQQLRNRLNELFRLDADFDAFCADYFPDIHQRFSGDADRVRRVTLLLSAGHDRSRAHSTRMSGECREPQQLRRPRKGRFQPPKSQPRLHNPRLPRRMHQGLLLTAQVV